MARFNSNVCMGKVVAYDTLVPHEQVFDLLGHPAALTSMSTNLPLRTSTTATPNEPATIDLSSTAILLSTVASVSRSTIDPRASDIALATTMSEVRSSSSAHWLWLLLLPVVALVCFFAWLWRRKRRVVAGVEVANVVRKPQSHYDAPDSKLFV